MMPTKTCKNCKHARTFKNNLYCMHNTLEYKYIVEPNESQKFADVCGCYIPVPELDRILGLIG